MEVLRSNGGIHKLSCKIDCRLEEATGLAFRFVIGRTKDQSKMSELKREVAEYADFLLLDIEEEYSMLPYKTLVWRLWIFFLISLMDFLNLIVCL